MMVIECNDLETLGKMVAQCVREGLCFTACAMTFTITLTGGY